MEIVFEVLIEALMRFILIPIGYVLTRPWGWIIVGILLAIVGFFYGNTSHQVVYQAIDHASLIPYFVKDKTDYFQEKNSSIYYIFHENDFSPTLQSDRFLKSSGFTFIARTDAENVDVKFSDDTQLQGSGYVVEEITFFNNKQTQTFSTSEYTQHPHGFYDDHSIVGKILVSVGILLSIVALVMTFVTKRKR